MISVTIRLMTISDYDDVYALWLSCVGMGLNDIDDSKVGIDKFLQRNPNTCFVATQDEQILGVILSGQDGRRAYIYHLAVAPTHRRQGIAERLVDEVMRVLDEIGISKAALVVFDKNQIGNDFWESQGFSVRRDLVYRNKSLRDLVRIDT
ncbi:GNAT family N-acetyltransferase [Moraxella canis]|uniref:GNAT family N-acetyltransferase n=1 Tax=Moraxella canis TaxID=90239 RepID=UPI000669B1B4|nr:GNAT family N-acetyltransferase [Moraxella canis]